MQEQEAACSEPLTGGDGSRSTSRLQLQVPQQQEFQEPTEGGEEEGQCGLNAGREKARRPPERAGRAASYSIFLFRGEGVLYWENYFLD